MKLDVLGEQSLPTSVCLLGSCHTMTQMSTLGNMGLLSLREWKLWVWQDDWLSVIHLVMYVFASD